MTTAVIKLVDANLIGNFYFTRDQAGLAKSLIEEGAYKVQGTLKFSNLSGEDAAEEIFDLTNNPSRQGDREALYGRHRSVSVGDIVEVDGVNYLCESRGWSKL